MSRLKKLYVIRLDKAVLEEPKFRKENPGYRPWKPCVYVGATSLDPEERFRQHKTGYKAGRGYVTKYGKYLMPRKYKRPNPVPSAEAEDRERDLAESLRRERVRGVAALILPEWIADPPEYSSVAPSEPTKPLSLYLEHLILDL